jgi:DNA integrity scanning protein DisA with diadenylate cyclase activity
MKLFSDICCPEKRGVRADVLESVLTLALEIAREGREGRKIGTIFVVGDTDNVQKASRPLILDPLFGHPDHNKLIELKDVRETIKELAQLDGAFLISGTGVAVSAARYIDVSTEGIAIPLGFGSRHMAGASITRVTNSVAVVVSESSMVRVFDDGLLISEIIPEIWMMNQHRLSTLDGDVRVRQESEITVRTRADAAPAA